MYPSIRKFLSTIGFHVAARCRAVFFLRAIRFFIRSAQKNNFSHFAHFLFERFDPNTIRKRLNLHLKPHYTIAQGVFGERYLLNVNDHIGWHIFVNGYFDLTIPTLGVLFQKLFPGKIFLDVGANIGSSSIALARRGVDVVAIEASPTVLHDLAGNVAMNSPIPYTIVNLAVTSAAHAAKESYATIATPNGNIAAASLVSNWNPSKVPGQREHVRLSTIDDIVGFFGIKALSAIKIDIEGYEYEALLGLARTFLLRPIIIFEWRPDIIDSAGGSVRDVRAVFPENYQLFGVDTKFEGVVVEVQFVDFKLHGVYANVIALPKEIIDSHSELAESLREKRLRIPLSSI